MRRQTNHYIMMGNLTSDPELSTTSSGISVCRFSVANNRDYKNKEGEEIKKVNYFRCNAWGKLGEIIAEHFKKGQQILIEGETEQRQWDDKDGNKRYSIELLVKEFQFMGSLAVKDAEAEKDQKPEYC